MAGTRATVTIDGVDYELAATIKAEGIYADEFWGVLPKPYRGVLEDDMLVTYNRSQATVKAYVKADKKGNPMRGEDGEFVIVEHGGVEVDVPNPEYRGFEAEALLRYVWAMGVAAGSIDESWADFGARMEDVDLVAREMAEVYATVMYGLGGGCIFRQPKGRRDAGDGDTGQRGEGPSADEGGAGVAQ